MSRHITVLILLALPFSVAAESIAVQRAEGFRMIWEPLKRPIEDTYEQPFIDVPKGHPHEPLITYAKRRKMFKEDSSFAPDASLKRSDALQWLLITRNVAYPDDVNEEALRNFIARYPLHTSPQQLQENAPVSQEELMTMIASLDEALRNERHTVSYYADAFHGKNTAFGESFDMYAMTAAHKTFPHNTLVRVTHEPTGKEVVVRINDRGPYVDGRSMDLSQVAFQKLAPLSRGLLSDVTFERLGSAAVVNACPRVRYQRRLGRALLNPGIPRIAQVGTEISLTADTSFRVLQMRGPRMKPVRNREWIQRGESHDIVFEKEGIYTFVLHEDSGGRRRFRTKVVGKCEEHGGFT